MACVPKNLRVSIIIPTLNEERVIGRAIRNLRAYLPKGVEIIVADGGSKDFTSLIARKLGAKVVTGGIKTVGGGRNAGAKASKGDILWFVDADTFPTKNFYDGMLAAFRNPAVLGVGCHIMPEHLSPFRTVFFYFLNLIVAGTVFLGRPNIAGSCVAYRRKDFDAINGFDTETHSAEDMDLTQRISKRGKIAFLYHVIVPTSDRRVHKLGLVGLMQDWTRASIMYIQGKKTAYYYAPR